MGLLREWNRVHKQILPILRNADVELGNFDTVVEYYGDELDIRTGKGTDVDSITARSKDDFITDLEKMEFAYPYVKISADLICTSNSYPREHKDFLNEALGSLNFYILDDSDEPSSLLNGKMIRFFSFSTDHREVFVENAPSANKKGLRLLKKYGKRGYETIPAFALPVDGEFSSMLQAYIENAKSLSSTMYGDATYGSMRQNMDSYYGESKNIYESMFPILRFE